MNQRIFFKRISLVATAALVASGAAMAQSSSTGNGGSSNATGAVNGSAGTSGLPGNSPSLPDNQNATPSSPPVDYNNADPTAAGNPGSTSATTSTHDKSRHSGSKKAKRSRDAASAPNSVLDDPNKAGGGSGNSNVR